MEISFDIWLYIRRENCAKKRVPFPNDTPIWGQPLPIYEKVKNVIRKSSPQNPLSQSHNYFYNPITKSS